MTQLTPLQEEAVKLYDAGINVYPSRKKGTDIGIKDLYNRRVPRANIEELFETDCNIGVVTGGLNHPYPFVIVCDDDVSFHHYIQKVEYVTQWKIWATKREQGGDIWLISGYQRVTDHDSTEGVHIYGSRFSKHLLPPSTHGNETYSWYRRDGDTPPIIYMDRLDWPELQPEAKPTYDNDYNKKIREEHWENIQNEIEEQLKDPRFFHLCRVFGIQITGDIIQMLVGELLKRRKESARKRSKSTN